MLVTLKQMFLWVVVVEGAVVDDTSDPLEVEGHPGVPGGDSQATADTSGHDADESCSVLIVSIFSLHGAPTVSLAGPTEYSLLILLSLGTARYQTLKYLANRKKSELTDQNSP